MKTENDPTAEDKRSAAEARFKRIATKRVNAAVKQMRLIGNCSGAGYYYTPAQIDTIRNALQQGLNDAMARFDREKKKDLEVEL